MLLIVCRSMVDMSVDSRAWTYVSALQETCAACAPRRAGVRKTIPKNRPTMLAALKDIHPQIGVALETEVNAAVGDQAKAETMFRGMFERDSGNVSKGRFAQALASQIQDDASEIEAPAYILDAIKHVCQ